MTTPAGLLRQLADIVGPAHCLSGSDRGPYVVDGRIPAAIVFPGSAEETSRVVAATAAAGGAVIPWGGGTDMGLGAPPRDGAVVVGTRRLARIVEHEPGDLTATVEAGLTMEALQAALAAKGQWLSLDPPVPARATLGGVLAGDASGPRRQLYGTARDLVIGIRVVGPDGELIRAGGKVVKNVAGYDLIKLYIGSRGTLGLIVEATLKLRPRPEADGAVWAGFAGLEEAGAALARLLGSDLLPHSVELLDAGAAEACVAATGHDVPAAAVLLVGFDGLPTMVAWQLAEAERFLAAARALRLDRAAATRAFEFVRDIRLAVPEPLAVAKAVVLPSEVIGFVAVARAVIQAAGLQLLATAHAGCGVVSLVLASAGGPPPGAAPAARVLATLRDETRARGGQLRVESAPLAVRETVSAWDTPGPAVPIMQRIKTELDPRGVMNPGRFLGGL